MTMRPVADTFALRRPADRHVRSPAGCRPLARRLAERLAILTVLATLAACTAETEAPPSTNPTPSPDEATTLRTAADTLGVRSDGATRAVPGFRVIGHFVAEIDPTSGVANARMLPDGQKQSAAVPSMDQGIQSNEDAGAVSGRMRFLQDASGNGQDIPACENFWTDGWAADDPSWPFWVPEAARTAFLTDLAGDAGNRFCTNFRLINDVGRPLQEIWIIVDGLTLPGVRAWVQDFPRVIPSQVDGDPDTVLEPNSLQGMFRYGPFAEDEEIIGQWYFYFGGAPIGDFRVRGRIVEIFREQCGTENDDNGDGLEDSGCGMFGAGSNCYINQDCLSSSCDGGVAADPMSSGSGTLGTCLPSGPGGACMLDDDCDGTMICSDADPVEQTPGTCTITATTENFEPCTSDAQCLSGFCDPDTDLCANATGYFVLTASTFNGNLGGLAGANQTCLDELDNGDWLGKEAAESRGLLDPAHIQAFLCTEGHCQDTQHRTDYRFARVGSNTAGGDAISTGPDGGGPGDTDAWSTGGRFDTDTSIWTGRAQGLNAAWSSGASANCQSWTTADGNLLAPGRIGRVEDTNTQRWSLFETTCNASSLRLVCMVHSRPEPEPEPAGCLTPWGTAIDHGDSVTAYAEALVCNGDPCPSETRTCDNGALSGNFLNEACNTLDTGACDTTGYFVLTSMGFNGNLGGLSGADDICRDQVRNQDWLGKNDAGDLSNERIHAFLCNLDECRNLRPNAVYRYARAGDNGVGGAIFRTDASGAGPGDLNPWSATDRFGLTSYIWTQRQAGTAERWSTIPAGGTTTACSNWSDAVTAAGVGYTPHYWFGAARRWGWPGNFNCSSNYRLICAVEPEDAFILGNTCTDDSDCVPGTWCPNDTSEPACAPIPTYDTTEMPFQFAPAGSFTMGSPPGELGRNPQGGEREAQVNVTLTRPFFIQRTPLTQGHWRNVLQAHNTIFGTDYLLEPSHFGPTDQDSCSDEDCPVERVNWWEAVIFANALSRLEGLEQCYELQGCSTGSGLLEMGAGCNAGTTNCIGDTYTCDTVTFLGPECLGYRLPTEAEWEYAARAGTTTATFAGNLLTTTGCVLLSGAGSYAEDTALASIAYYGCNDLSRTRRTGQLGANAWGLHDTLGNVNEWVWNWYDEVHSDGLDPTGPATGTERVWRGASFFHVPSWTRAAFRRYNLPDLRFMDRGFRLVRTSPVDPDLDCGEPGLPTDGGVLLPDGTGFGAEAVYNCDSGFTLVGEAIRQCIGNGEWVPEIPTCVE